MTMYSRVCCHYLMALFCALALLSSIQAELSAADAVVEARNDEGGMELGQPQVDKELNKAASVMKMDLSKIPLPSADGDEKMETEKPKKPVDGEAAPEQLAAIHKPEDSKKENEQLVMNAEVLKQPGMARLARHIKSFHNYQTRQGQVRAANNFDNDDDYDDDVVAEERAVRRRKRIRRRNANNRLRRTHRRKNVANRRHEAVRRPNVNRSTKRRSSNKNKRRSGSKKSSKPKRSKKSGRRSNKKNSRKTKRTKKNRKSSRRQFASQQDDNSARKQVKPSSQMIVIVDGGAGEAVQAVAQAA